MPVDDRDFERDASVKPELQMSAGRMLLLAATGICIVGLIMFASRS